MKAKKYKDTNEMYQNTYSPCVDCEKGDIMGDDVYKYEYVCGASLKKYKSCKHKEHIRNIHNIYMEALIKAYENGEIENVENLRNENLR